MTDNKIDVRDVTERSRYEVRVDGAAAGFAAYRVDGGQITFTHTDVDPAFEGHGVGSELIRTALDDVRGKDLRVIAQCPFVASYIESHPDYRDLLAR